MTGISGLSPRRSLSRRVSFGLVACLVLGSACHAPAPGSLQVTVAALSSDCPQEIRARLRVPAQDIDCPLTRVDQGFEGSCKVRASGTLVFELEYWSVTPEFLLASARKEVTLGGDSTEALTFVDGELVYPDQDGDDLSTFDELCLERKPDAFDSPRFDGVEHETDAIGKRFGRHTIAERLRITGSHFPNADRLKITVGPLLDGPSVELAPLSVSPNEIVVQLPAGLDTGRDVTLTVDAFGKGWTEQLRVARVWGVATRVNAGLFLFAHGNYAAPPAPLTDHHVALASACTTFFCQSRFWAMTADGRHLLMSMSFVDPTELFVVDIPTGSPWPKATAWPQHSSFALVEADAYLATVDPSSPGAANLSLFGFDAQERRIASSPNDRVGVPGAEVVAAHGDTLFVYYRDTSIDGVRRFRVAQGKLSKEGEDLALPNRCPTEGCGELSFVAIDNSRIVLAREVLDQVDLIDLAERDVESATVERPSYLALAPRSRAWVAVANVNDTGEPRKDNEIGLCAITLDAFATPSAGCPLVGSTGKPTSVAIAPEESVLLMTGGLASVNVYPYELGQTASALSPINLGQWIYSFAIQP